MRFSTVISFCWRTLLLPGLLLCAAQSSFALNADQRLEAIKQALIDLSLGSELQLASSAYLDERGVLHESSIITSRAHVRGVRVLSYLEEAGIGTANVEASVTTSECPVARPGLRRQALVSVNHGVNNPRLGDYYLSEIAALSQQIVSSALVANSGWSAESRQQFASSYHQKMSATGGSRPPYELQMVLREVQTGLPSGLAGVKPYLVKQGGNALFWGTSKIPVLSDRQPWPDATLAYEMRLVDPVLAKIIASNAGQIHYPRQQRGYAKTQLPAQFVAQLTAASERFVGQLNEALICSPHYYHVSSSAPGSERVMINAGSAAGVKVGDQFLLSRTPEIIGQAASLEDIQGLVLAEVQSVDPHSATLAAVAGPRRNDVAVAGNELRDKLSHYVAIYF